jgi:hypothetical protein
MYTPGYSYFNWDFIKNSEEVVAGGPNARNRRYNVARVDHEEEKLPLNLYRHAGPYIRKELSYNNEPLKFGYASTKLYSFCLMEDNTFKCASQIPFENGAINDETYENSYRSQISIRWSISPETFYQQRLMFMNDELEGRIPDNEYDEHARTVYASHNYTPDDVLKTGDKILNQIRTQLKRKFGESNPVYMLKALTRFVKNIPYVYDTNSREFIKKYLGRFYDGLVPGRMLQAVHLPDVTLAVGGDCEDLALLLYYLLQKSEYEYQPAMVWRKLPNGRLFGFDNPSKSEGGVAWYNHVGVAIPLTGEFENYFYEEYIGSDEIYKYTFEQYGQRFFYLETTNQERIGSAEVEAGEDVEILYWPQQDEKIEYPNHELFAEDDPMFSRPDESDSEDDDEDSE